MKIFVSPLSRLDETIRLSGARRILTLMSEGTFVQRPAGFAGDDILRLTFHDIAQPRDGLNPPSLDQVAQILAFGRAWDQREPMLIHCHAGISRSTAAAYALACALMPGCDEVELARELRRLSPSATPNPLVVAHADRLLDRQGRMTQAIAGIGRGADAFEGNPFALDIA